MNDLLSYIFKIIDKPQFIKDYFFTNDLIKPIAPKILKPNPIPITMRDKAKAKIDGMVEDELLTPIANAMRTLPAFFGIKPMGYLDY